MEVREALQALRQHRLRIFPNAFPEQPHANLHIPLLSPLSLSLSLPPSQFPTHSLPFTPCAAAKPQQDAVASRCFLLHSTKSRSACENTNIEIELQHNCNESLLRSSFEMLRAGTISVVQADLHYRRHLLWSSFHTWQKHASILRKIKFGIGRQRVRVGSRCFEEWKENAQFAGGFRDLRRRALEARASVLVHQSFDLWQRFHVRKRKTRLNLEVAARVHDRSRVRHALALLSQNKLRRVNRREQLGRAKGCFGRRHLKPCWERWQKLVLLQRRKHEIEESAGEMYERQCIRRGFQRLLKSSKLSRTKRILAVKVSIAREASMKRKWIARWKTKWEDQTKVNRAERFALMRAWRCFIDATRNSLSLRCKDALKVWRQKLKRKCLVALACSAARERQTRRVLCRVLKTYAQKIAFSQFRMHLEERHHLVERIVGFEKHRDVKTLRVYFDALLGNVSFKQKRRSQLGLGTFAYAKRCKALALRQLKQQLKRRRKWGKEKVIADVHFLKAHLIALVQACAFQKRSREKLKLGEQAYFQRSKRQSLMDLHTYALKNRETRMRVCEMRWRYSCCRRRRLFESWRDFAEQESQERVACIAYSRRTVNRALAQWKRHVDCVVFERKRLIVAEKFYFSTQSRSTVQTLWLFAGQRKATRAAVRFSQSQAKRRAMAKLLRFKSSHQKLCSQAAIAEAFLTCRRQKAGLAVLLQLHFSKQAKRLKLGHAQEQVVVRRKQIAFRKYWVITLTKKQLRKHLRRFQQVYWLRWQEFQTEIEQERLSESHFRSQTTRVAFARLRKSCLELVELRSIESEVSNLWRRGVLRRVLADWKQSWLHWRVQSNMLAAAQCYHNDCVLQTFFREWKAEYATNRLALEFYRLHLVRWMKQCFEAWRSQVLATLVEETNEAVAELHWRKDVLRRHIGLWQLGIAATKREEAADRYVTSMRLKRCFQAWKAEAMAAKVQKVEMVVADVFWRKKALQKCFHLLALASLDSQTSLDTTIDISFFRDIN